MIATHARAALRSLRLVVTSGLCWLRFALAVCEDGCSLPWRNDVCDGYLSSAAEEELEVRAAEERCEGTGACQGHGSAESPPGFQPPEETSRSTQRVRIGDVVVKFTQSESGAPGVFPGKAYFELRCDGYDSATTIAQRLSETLWDADSPSGEGFHRASQRGTRDQQVLFYTLCLGDGYARTYCEPLVRSFEAVYPRPLAASFLVLTDSAEIVRRHRARRAAMGSVAEKMPEVFFLPWRRVCSAEQNAQQAQWNCDNNSAAMFERLVSFLKVIDESIKSCSALRCRSCSPIKVVVIDSDSLFVRPMLPLFKGDSADFAWLAYEVNRTAPYENEWFEQSEFCNHRGNDASSLVDLETKIQRLTRLRSMKDYADSVAAARREGQDESTNFASMGLTFIGSDSCFVRVNAGMFVINNIGERQREYLRFHGALSGFMIDPDAFVLDPHANLHFGSPNPSDRAQERAFLTTHFPELVENPTLATRLRELFRGPDQIAIIYMLFGGRHNRAFENGENVVERHTKPSEQSVLSPDAQILRAWSKGGAWYDDDARNRGGATQDKGDSFAGDNDHTSDDAIEDPRFGLKHRFLPAGTWFLAEPGRSPLPYSFHYKGRSFWDAIFSDRRTKVCLEAWKRASESDADGAESLEVLANFCHQWIEEYGYAGATRRLDWLQDSLFWWSKFAAEYEELDIGPL
eukprot:CAMPEP_0170317434 /NCGR_PEP_ID=MMETSP0116_2-20130129/59386_1 /TAXON_ID=400756 /ORGANISM="Durinskia baltica, Strain CSIRO CS-38" /LENGTH=688 /DNA_ID=CAMNT_0010570075 /DNA_START=61 /DNA_END=2124 /DNA_ORIENTATION=+